MKQGRGRTHHLTIGPAPCTCPTPCRSSPINVAHSSTGSNGRIRPRTSTRSRIIDPTNFFIVPVALTTSCPPAGAPTAGWSSSDSDPDEDEDEASDPNSSSCARALASSCTESDVGAATTSPSRVVIVVPYFVLDPPSESEDDRPLSLVDDRPEGVFFVRWCEALRWVRSCSWSSLMPATVSAQSPKLVKGEAEGEVGRLSVVNPEQREIERRARLLTSQLLGT